eukprot:TRINITY_DN4473_c0_g1_i7.p2 TRINITY_DN4473_c0_g1~~TRINITY_DN4473_c0_g1_i7.p2  ORF type:complete len:107 (+),score=21.22 TRINITY_DN4473_c0_g1_i7:52-372(+)
MLDLLDQLSRNQTRLQPHVLRNQLQQVFCQLTHVLVQWVQWVTMHPDDQRQQAAIVTVSAIPREDGQILTTNLFLFGPKQGPRRPEAFHCFDACLIELEAFHRRHV